MSKAEDRIKEIELTEENLKALRKAWYPAGSGPLSAMGTICGLIDAIAKEKGFNVK